MKRDKDEGKITGPMFPRLHVNDTEKGGPRAPPRNKMALYEQLSIPSQRFNPGAMTFKPNNSANLASSASSSQGNELERTKYYPPHLSRAAYSMEKQHDRSELGARLVQLEQKRIDDDDFAVPIFVNSGMERHPSFSPANAAHLMNVQNTGDKEPKQASRGEKFQSEENSKSLSVREKTGGPPKQTTSSLYQDHKEHRGNVSRLQETDACLNQECRVRSQLGNSVCGNGFPNEPMRDKENKNFPLISRREFFQGEEGNPGTAINYSDNNEDETCESLQQGHVDGSDDVSEVSMVDSLSGLDLSPDDVVGIIGQKHFWKARKAIVNQQRAFAVQVFELHRLIKVQRLIAGSPQVMVEENAYLTKSFKGSPAKKLPLEYVVKPPPYVLKHKVNPEKPTHKIECSAENAVEKAAIFSPKNSIQPPSYPPFSGNPSPTPSTTDAGTAPWGFQQAPGNQWLFPVMSPSEGLIYKPYPGPGFMGPVCGGYGPPGSSPMMIGNYVNPAYGVHPLQYQGMGFPPMGHGFPPMSHGYFPPYGMPVMSQAVSGSSVEQMNNFGGIGSHGHPSHFSGGTADFNVNLQHQSSFNLSNPRDEAVSNAVKSSTKRPSSTASSPSERPRVAINHATEERDERQRFSPSPVIHVPDGDPEPVGGDGQTRVIRVVPRNARSATESAARIFQSIQEERRQYDLV